MTWLGVPILDWVLLVFVLGLGVEAWLTTRSADKNEEPDASSGHDRNAGRSEDADRSD